ncbi:MAG: response regulator [Candidatus Thorarchaeota archaeon]|nr:response regulator [Candidatus Thorarchaeota archaeon]
MTARLLIVDDDIDVAKLLRAYLKKTGSDVEISYARSCKRAIRKVKEAILSGLPPHACLVDIKLPDTTGTDCIRQLQAMGLANLCAFTAYSKPQIIEEAKRAGAVMVLKKSAGFAAIADTLAQLLDLAPLEL